MCVFGFPDEPPGGEALYRQAMQFCNFFLGLKDDFPNEPWFVDIVNYLVVSVISPSFSEFERTKLKSETKYYIWEDPILWRMGSDQVIMRCVPDIEIPYVLELCHSSPFGGHYGTQRTSRKVLDCGLYWPTIFKYAQRVYENCEQCQRAAISITRRDEVPQQPMLYCEVFDIWGIDFACCRLCLQMGGSHSYKD